MHTSLRRIVMAAAAVIAVGAATAALPRSRRSQMAWWRLVAGMVMEVGASRSASVRPIKAATMAARITHYAYGDETASCSATG